MQSGQRLQKQRQSSYANHSGAIMATPVFAKRIDTVRRDAVINIFCHLKPALKPQTQHKPVGGALKWRKYKQSLLFFSY